jgi:hypothetical protein
VIGGLAVQRWGEPRLTRDIDISLLAGFGGEEGYVDLTLGAYAPRIGDASPLGLTHRVLLCVAPLESEAMIDRASLAELAPGRKLRVCSPEVLVIMRVFAGRDTDLRDARTVIRT